MEFDCGRRLILISMVLAVCLPVGCGGSSSSSGSTEGSTSSSTRSTQPAAGFSTKAGAAVSGEEASEDERAQASETLERNMSARATGNYEVQCETLSATVVEAIEKSGGRAVTGKEGCADKLEAEGQKAPAGLLANNLVGPIAALRIQGNRGVALYHGTENQDYAMRMELENGEWKVAATLTETLPSN